MELRPYQLELIEKAREAMRSGKKSIVLVSPVGSGKTLLTAHMLKTAANKGLSSVFCVPRRELLAQSVRAFAHVGVNHGIIAAGFQPDPTPLVQIASIQTYVRRLKTVRKPNLLIIDEGHHICAASWSSVVKAYPDAYKIFLTATPVRLDGQGLGTYAEYMVHGPSVSWLIDNGFLSKYKLFAPNKIDLSGVGTRMGDFIKSGLVLEVDKPKITGSAISEYKKHANGKRAVVFCVSVEHSKHVEAQFNASGIRAAHVDGETHIVLRDTTIKQFDSGEIKVLCNVDLFGEGFDLPALECVILLRPTKSLGLYLQQCGRVLRPSPGKTHATILDHVGNVEAHGLPDEEREWTLDGRKKRSADKLPVRTCPVCFGVMKPSVVVCLYCNHAFKAVDKPRVVEEVDGDLSEVDLSTARRKKSKEQASAHTLQDLIAIGKARKYRNPYGWARQVFSARQAKKLREGRP